MRQVLIPTSLARVPRFADAGQCLTLAGETMGTTWQVHVWAPASELQDLDAAIQQELRQVVAQMSHWEPASDISRFNTAAPDSLVELPDPLFELLQRARRVASDSDGAYDPTAGALANRWGFGPDAARFDPGFQLPGDAEIESLRRRCGWQLLQLERPTHHAYQPGGLQLDLSSIAKGLAVDLVAERLLREGHPSHLVEIGGELRGSGIKPDAQPWWVAVESPAVDPGLDESCIALCDRAIATSGDYRRWYQAGERRIAHTLDPRSGKPVDNDVASVTVVSEDCWHADAISTALMVMGREQGLAYADQRGIAARFTLRTEAGLREACSAAWSGMLQ